MTKKTEKNLRRNFRGALERLQKSRAGDVGAETNYVDAYQELVKNGYARQIKKKYRRS